MAMTLTLVPCMADRAVRLPICTWGFYVSWNYIKTQNRIYVYTYYHIYMQHRCINVVKENSCIRKGGGSVWSGEATALPKYGFSMILMTGTWCATFCRVATGGYLARAKVHMKAWEWGQERTGLPNSLSALVLLSILVFERWFYVLWLLRFIFFYNLRRRSVMARKKLEEETHTCCFAGFSET